MTIFFVMVNVITIGIGLIMAMDSEKREWRAVGYSLGTVSAALLSMNLLQFTGLIR